MLRAIEGEAIFRYQTPVTIITDLSQFLLRNSITVIPKVGYRVPLNYTKFGTIVFTKWFLGNFN